MAGLTQPDLRQPAATRTDASVIHDIGYQRYTGDRLGRGHVASSLYLHSLRTAFGLGRSAKAKIFPWTVVGLVSLVAVILTAIRAQTGEVALSYLEFPGAMSLLAILFAAIVAPELVSRDLRSGVLSLYFSRPLRRGDYALTKLAALISATWLLLGAPQLVMFTGGAFGGKGASDVWREFTDLVPGVLFAGIYAVVISSVALLIASLTGKRAFAAAGVVAAFIVTTPLVGLLLVTPSKAAQQLAGVASPATLAEGVGGWLFGHDADEIGSYGPVYGAVAVALVAACTLLLLVRYRKVSS